MNEQTHNCPICQLHIDTNPRYPNEICSDCAEKATTVDGRALELYNQDGGGGYIAYFTNTQQKEKYDSHIVYIDGKKCWADERYLGGIVIVPYQEK